ncbi:hypothetical protein SBRCBS47491_002622 [Sporothrix bragantina]|uniref:Ubiquitin-like domain-containing protein n=1 Tax=Sporothrix bragantina TaxID=671064 RepID=A0ABP0B8P6_9PEZI
MSDRDSDRASGRLGRSSPPTMTSALAASSSSSPFLSAPSPHRGGAPPLHLTARFLSLPDVQIEMPDPSRVTVVGLKTLIRQQLVRKAAQAAAEPPSPTSSSRPRPKEKEKEKETEKETEKEKEKEQQPLSPTLQDAHRRRLRIIYAGKILADDVVLGSVLRPVPPPPRAGRSPSVSTSTASTPVGNQSTNIPSDARSGTGSSTPLGDGAAFAARVYVNCSIGDIMPASELSAESDAAAVAAVLHSRGSGASLAASASGTLTPGAVGGRSGGGGPMRIDPLHRRGASGGGGSGGPSSSPLSSQQQQPGGHSVAGGSSDTTTPAPRGFERLLQAGFTPAEVNQLRLQFNTIQSTRFTPDTMPSPDSLRTMEDSWLDNNQGGGPGGGGGTAGFGGSGGAGGPAGDDGNPLPEDTGLPGMLDIMVRAMVIGFVFPLGSISWLMREEGLWTARWRMFVSMGVVVSLMIGSVKTLAGEW